MNSILQIAWAGTEDSQPRCILRQTLSTIVFCLALSLPLCGQTASSKNVPRDPDALNAVESAIQALGGKDALAGIRDSHIEAQCTQTTKTKTTTHRVRWIMSGSSFRFDGGDQDGRGVLNGPWGAHVTRGDNMIPLRERSLRAIKPIQLPELMLLKDLDNTTNPIEVIGHELIGGNSVVHIRVIDAYATAEDAEPQEEHWYFDTKSGLPVQLEYTAPATNSLLSFTSSIVSYSSFQEDAPLMIAHVITRKLANGPETTCTIDHVSFNENPDSSMFSPKRDGGK